MALVKCKECGEDVYEKAETCTKCGAPTVHTEEAYLSVLRWAFIIVLLVVGNPSKSDHVEKTGVAGIEDLYVYDTYFIFSTLRGKDDGHLWSWGALWYVKAKLSI